MKHGISQRNVTVPIAFLLAVLAGAFVTGCESKPKATDNPYTFGNVQIKLKKGMSQDEVLKEFSSPNIKTIDTAGREVWTYHRNSSAADRDRDSRWFVIGESQEQESTQRSMSFILVVKFDEAKRVSEFDCKEESY